MTRSLARKILSQVELSQLCDLVKLSALKVDGLISLSGKAEGTTEPGLIPQRQIPLFEEAEELIEFPKEHSFSTQADRILRLYGLLKPAKSRGKAKVSMEPWRGFFSSEAVAALVKKDRKILLLLPEESYIELFQKAVPKKLSEKVIRFSPDIGTQALISLESKLLDQAGLIVLGKRSANFLNFYASFDEVIILDPASPRFRSDSYPHYSVLQNLYLYSLIMPIDIRIIPLSPFPPTRSFPPLRFTTYGLKGSSDERIHQAIEALANLCADGKKKTLVYNDAVGLGQCILCPNCEARISCPSCKRQLIYSSDKRKFLCSFCKYSSSSLSCPFCGSKDLAIQILGVEGMAKLLRKELRECREPPRPRVGAIYEERRRKIRVPNLARTDVLIGTSTLFSPLMFYRPENIVYVARQLNRIGTTAPFEEQIEDELCRLHNLYGGSNVPIHVIGDSAIVSSIKKLLGKRREITLRESTKLKQLSGLPPFGVIVGFSAYATSKDTLDRFISQALGQLELLHKPRWIERTEILPGREEGKWVLRGRFCVHSPDSSLLSELRIQGKNRRVDLVFNAHYY